jgi:hypothetical protein
MFTAYRKSGVRFSYACTNAIPEFQKTQPKLLATLQKVIAIQHLHEELSGSLQCTFP